MTIQEINHYLEKESPFVVFGDNTKTNWDFEHGQLRVGNHYVSDYKIEILDNSIFVDSTISLGFPTNYLIYLPTFKKQIFLNYDKAKIESEIFTTTNKNELAENRKNRTDEGMYVLISKEQHPEYLKDL